MKKTTIFLFAITFIVIAVTSCSLFGYVTIEEGSMIAEAIFDDFLLNGTYYHENRQDEAPDSISYELTTTGAFNTLHIYYNNHIVEDMVMNGEIDYYVVDQSETYSTDPIWAISSEAELQIVTADNDLDFIWELYYHYSNSSSATVGNTTIPGSELNFDIEEILPVFGYTTE